jgi:transposase
MCIIISKTIKEEKLRWILPIYRKQISLVAVANLCPYSQRSLERWLKTYREHGEQGLEPQSTKPKTNLRETPIRIKEEIIQLRQETKECTQILSWKLTQEKNIKIHPRTIGKIIKKEGLTKKYRIRKIKYKDIKAPMLVGDILEIDVKDVPQRLNSKRYYQFTAINCASRWRYLKIYEHISNYVIL